MDSLSVDGLLGDKKNTRKRLAEMVVRWNGVCQSNISSIRKLEGEVARLDGVIKDREVKIGVEKAHVSEMTEMVSSLKSKIDDLELEVAEINGANTELRLIVGNLVDSITE